MRKTIFTAVGSLVVLSGGCAQPQVAKVWDPQPLVHWKDLTHDPVVPVRDEFRIMPGKMPAGIFPGSLAVTRVSMEKTDDSDRPLVPRLTSDPRNEFLQWNSALDDQFAVGEVFPVSAQDLGAVEADPDQILAAFDALHARLGFVYAVNELSETETEMLGVLYDPRSKTTLAVLQVQSESVVPPEVVEESEEPIDMWKTDSHALVRAKFETVLRGCIHELIERDRPARMVTPVGWKSTQPVRSVVWPPRKKRMHP